MWHQVAEAMAAIKLRAFALNSNRTFDPVLHPSQVHSEGMLEIYMCRPPWPIAVDNCNFKTATIKTAMHAPTAHLDVG